MIIRQTTYALARFIVKRTLTGNSEEETYFETLHKEIKCVEV